LFVGPIGLSGRQCCQKEVSIGQNVTTVTAGVTWTFLQENWLDPGSKNTEIQSISWRGRQIGSGVFGRMTALANPFR